MRRCIHLSFLALAGLGLWAGLSPAQPAAAQGGPRSARAEQDWPHPGNDPGGMRHSPLAQIDRSNVASLAVAWTFDTGDWSDGSSLPSRSAFEATPLVIDGVLYVPSAFSRLFALDAETGRELWVFDPKVDTSVPRNLYVNRGVSSWTDGKRRLVFLGDVEGRLWGIDAATGRPDPAFGAGGRLDLRPGMADAFPDAQYGLTSPAAVCGDVVVTGSLVSDAAPRGPSGDVRGFDARTGKLLWRFHTVPRPGEAGHETWEGESWKDRGGTNAWSFLSVDEGRGLVFLPLTSPSYDFYGGDRRGANLFGNSVVALECATGKRRWHFQTIHHDIWDYDLPAAPVLVTVTRDGKDVPAVAQVTKTGFVFVLHRETGEPLFPVEERPFPKSAIPGEAAHPTQPVPLKPPPFARQRMSREDLTDVTPESRKECEAIVAGARLDTSLYEPLGELDQALFPGLNGGANYGGASFDPGSRLLFVNSMDVGGLFRLQKRREGASIPYALRARKYEFFTDSKGYPCQKPPWGTLTAIDLDSGEFRWQVRLGELEELTRLGVPKTGAPNIGGSIVTDGGLVFIAATNDRRFRAFDRDTGRELWSAELPASGFATPMTFLGRKTGRQIVVIAAGGGNKYDQAFGGQLVAFGLPPRGAPAASGPEGPRDLR
ncbi:MAG TPA: pyrroloquinoline quinone-dependent dehydrogenase [Vicinamibacteria bacterium]